MDLYIVLGIERAASLEDIKRAYKRLARKFHPDINPGDRMAAQHFRQISDAYETLSDPERRRRYDTVGIVIESAEPTTFGFEGFDFSVSVNGASASTFGDLFADALRSRQEALRAGGPARGADVHQTMALSFEEAMRGGTRDVAARRLAHCRVCRGVGFVGTATHRCGGCQGVGAVRSVRGHMVFAKTCTQCGGTGHQSSVRCTACSGQQTEVRVDTVRVTLPSGAADGERLHLDGLGHAGPNGGEPGDLYLTLQVAPHRVFRREGNDLHLAVPIAIHEAALGAKVEIPSIDGESARIRVPPGTQSGQRFRLRERGVPSPRDGRRGDLVAEVQIVLPTLLDERSKALLREFGHINSGSVRDDLFST
jgi:molecular chaperone DnaJ